MLREIHDVKRRQKTHKSKSKACSIAFMKRAVVVVVVVDEVFASFNSHVI